MFNIPRLNSDPTSHSDHLAVLAYQEAHGGRKPGGTEDDMWRQDSKDVVTLYDAYGARFDTPLNLETGAEDRTPNEAMLAWRKLRAAAWQELEEAGPAAPPQAAEEIVIPLGWLASGL